MGSGKQQAEVQKGSRQQQGERSKKRVRKYSWQESSLSLLSSPHFLEWEVEREISWPKAGLCKYTSVLLKLSSSPEWNNCSCNASSQSGPELKVLLCLFLSQALTSILHRTTRLLAVPYLPLKGDLPPSARSLLSLLHSEQYLNEFSFKSIADFIKISINIWREFHTPVLNASGMGSLVPARRVSQQNSNLIFTSLP